jgi:hypothetical protein
LPSLPAHKGRGLDYFPVPVEFRTRKQKGMHYKYKYICRRITVPY